MTAFVTASASAAAQWRSGQRKGALLGCRGRAAGQVIRSLRGSSGPWLHAPQRFASDARPAPAKIALWPSEPGEPKAETPQQSE